MWSGDTDPYHTQLVIQLDDPCYSYLDFCMDHASKKTIQATEKYRAAMYW